MRFAFLDPIPVPEPPSPYRLVGHSPGSEPAWAALLSESGEFGEWTVERLRQEMLANLLPEGGAFVECDGRLVACASACAFPAFEPDSVLMYVVTLREHRGSGLGRLVTAAVMEAARRGGYPGIVLQTDVDRLAAIRTYLRLGFVPVLDVDASMPSRWDAIMGRLRLQAADLGVPPDQP
jgi:mycothiol synthase